MEGGGERRSEGRIHTSVGVVFSDIVPRSIIHHAEGRRLQAFGCAKEHIAGFCRQSRGNLSEGGSELL